MVYAGWCSKHITALLQAEGCNAIGLSGADGNAIRAAKRAPVHVENLGESVGTIGHYYNIIEWISDEEAESLMPDFQ
jgi:acetylglutamate kinase